MPYIDKTDLRKAIKDAEKKIREYLEAPYPHDLSGVKTKHAAGRKSPIIHRNTF